MRLSASLCNVRLSASLRNVRLSASLRNVRLSASLRNVRLSAQLLPGGGMGYRQRATERRPSLADLDGKARRDRQHPRA